LEFLFLMAKVMMAVPHFLESTFFAVLVLDGQCKSLRGYFCMVTRILGFHFSIFFCSVTRILLYGYEDTTFPFSFVWLRGYFCMVTRTFVWLRGFHFSIFFCMVTRILLYGYEDTRIPLFHFPLYGC
jgi:hypothetical protein